MSFSNSKLFEEIALFFTTHGFKLYMVGGTSRDFLLQREITDYDFATDATPTDMREFLPDANYQFSRFGTVSFKHEGKRVEITTLRKEDNYLDFRRPSTVTFVKNTKTI